MITPHHNGPWKSSWIHRPLTADGEPSACLARRRLRCVPWYWPPTPRRGRDQPQASAARTARRQEWRQARRRARGKGIANRVGGQCGEHHVAVWLQATAAPFALRTNRMHNELPRPLLCRYTHFFYTLSPSAPHRVLATSAEWCLPAAQDDADCESIQCATHQLYWRIH